MPDISIGMWLNYIIQILFTVLGGYYFIISLFSFIPKREKVVEQEKLYDYALIVAAHNEEQVIENMVESLKALDYPDDKYQIFVIADNCTDSTAALARAAGATVMERFDAEARGKGFALEWMFAQIYEMDRKFDNIVIFDADNVVDKNFLKAINKQHNQGYKVVQGYIDSKNPYDSWVTYSYSIAFWSINRLYQQSRCNLGLSCQLCGTGFSMAVDVLKEIGWGATCLTEDMEFTMKLSLHDIKVGYARGAIVYDEKPLTFSQSWKQRIRWMQGHADVASRFLGKLTKKAIKEHKFSPLDCGIYLLQPLRILTMGVITVFGWIQTVYPDSNLVLWGLVPANVWNIYVILQFLWTPLVLVIENRFSKRLLWGYFAYMFYNITWVPIAIIGMLKKNQKEWFHTQHTRKISINEMN